MHTTLTASDAQAIGKTRDLHVKGVPEDVWRRARCNATLSGIAFKTFVIRLLRECEPLAASPDTCNEKSAVDPPAS